MLTIGSGSLREKKKVVYDTGCGLFHLAYIQYGSSMYVLLWLSRHFLFSLNNIPLNELTTPSVLIHLLKDTFIASGNDSGVVVLLIVNGSLLSACFCVKMFSCWVGYINWSKESEQVWTNDDFRVKTECVTETQPKLRHRFLPSEIPLWKSYLLYEHTSAAIRTSFRRCFPPILYCDCPDTR